MDEVVEDGGQLTAAWLSGALGRDVVAVDRRPIGTGQMGSSWRLELTYGDGAGGPASLVAKLANGDRAAREQMAFGFRKELGFYREIASTVAVRAPKAHYAAITDDGADFTLLLDDLTPARPGVQVEGCSFEQARAAVRNLAALHGPRWNDPTLRDHDFLSPLDAGVAELFGAALAGAVDPFVERYGDALGPDDVATLRACAEVVTPWLLDRATPCAVVHGDYRLDNLMFAPGGDEVTALDWQTVSVGAPGRDLAYFLGNSFEPDDRRRHEDALVAAYHDELVDRGVTGYDLEQCTDDYRAGHLQGPLITILGAVYATAQRSDSADQMFLAMARRACAAIRDLDTLSRIP